ncbi:MAG: hypothetical protein PHS96_02035 [Anaerolineales bacterium]|nr:hypothetical protein [Anaerolineales bacterium]
MAQPVAQLAAHIVQGRFLLAEDGDAILIGKGLADFLSVQIGDRLILVGRRQDGAMRQRSMTVVGVYSLGMAEAEKGIVFITLPEAQTLYGLRGQTTEVPSIYPAWVGKNRWSLRCKPSCPAWRSIPGRRCVPRWSS